MTTASSYDPIAEYYQRAWADWYGPFVRPALEGLFFPEMPPGARVLDACCGCGHVTQELAAAGYKTTGFDLSRRLIERAAAAVPEARFFVADARRFAVRPVFRGAICTFDSLNHLLTSDDLEAALRAVRQALQPGSPFFFDMNVPEAYSLDLQHWARHEENDAVGFVRGQYDPLTGRAETQLTWFVREAGEGALWRRSDATVVERSYELKQIRAAVKNAGFCRAEYYTAAEAGTQGELGFGRIYGRVWS